MARETMQSLREELARVKRERDAASEWMCCEALEGGARAFVVEDTEVAIGVMGLGRASGGVARIYVRGFAPALPVYLDDLLARLARDDSDAMRAVARRISAARDEANRLTA